MKTLILKPNDASVVEINGTLNFNPYGDRVMPWSLGVLASMLRHLGDEVHFLDALALRLSGPEVGQRIQALSPDRVIASINPICLRKSTAFLHGLDVPAILLTNEPFQAWIQDRCPGAQIIYGDWFSALTGSQISIDAYPLPAFDLMPMQLYNHQQTILTEGCNHRCLFCHFGRLLDRPWRSRTIPAILQELTALRSYGLRFIRIVDNELALDRDFAKELLKAIIRQKLELVWETNTRVSNLDDELVSLMAKAGCIYTGYGIECANNQVLAANNKNITVDQIREAAKLFRQHGILDRTYVLVGLKSADAPSVYQTFNFLREDIESFDTSFDLVIPYPDTAYFGYLQDHGNIYSEVQPAHITWIEKYLYQNPLLEGEETARPAWDYDLMSFQAAYDLVVQLRDQAKAAGQARKFWGLLSKGSRGVKFLAQQFKIRPLGMVQRIWKS